MGYFFNNKMGASYGFLVNQVMDSYNFEKAKKDQSVEI
jgi:hypothetical protein